jgi:hypothetical protein
MRIDLSKPLQQLDLEPYVFKFSFSKPGPQEAVIHFTKDRKPQLTWHQSAVAPPQNLTNIAALKIIELGLPLSLFPGQPETFEWVLILEKDGQEVERWPADTTINHPYPSEENFVQSWTL